MTEKERCTDFATWLVERDKIVPQGVVQNLNFISEYANKHGIVKKNIWAITDVKELNMIRMKISGNKFFKMMHKREHQLFEKAGKLYADYIKECAEKIERINQEEIEQVHETKLAEQIDTEQPSIAPAEQNLAKSDIHKKRVRRGVAIKDAEEFLKGKGLNGATVQEIIEEIQPSAAVYPTRLSLDACSNVIAMPHERYVYADAFVDLDEAEDKLRHILTVHFSEFDGYSNNKLLYGAASHDLSMFLNDNDCDDVDSVYALARHFFEKRENRDGYLFSNPHIFSYSPDHPLNLKGVMMHFARNNGGILIADDAETYLQKTLLSYGGMGQLLGIAESNTFLIYDSERYILSEVIGTNEKWSDALHARLDELFRKEDVAYVIPRDINDIWFKSLPVLPHGLSWTLLLLQEIIKKFPNIGFKIITSDLMQSYDTVAAAFVPADSPLQSFADIVSFYMSEKYVLPKRMSCEELRQELLRAGMIEGNELIYALPKALNDYRFSWTDENKTVLVRCN